MRARSTTGRRAARPARTRWTPTRPGAAGPASAGGAELRADLLLLLGSPEGGDKTWVTEQYDRYVRGDTVLAMPHDAGLLRVDEETGLGVALATDGNGRYCQLDPYAGTQLALAEAYRNVAVTGARPLAVTNCLNFGSPEDPAVMWQFTEAVRGLADGCLAARHPGDRRQRQLLQPDRRDARSSRRRSSACSACTTTCAAGSGPASPAGRQHRAARARPGPSSAARCGPGCGTRHLGGRPPAVDLDAERALAERAGRRRRPAGCVVAAHDLSDGGLAVALAESCLAGGTGCTVTLPRDPATFLFSESAARAVVAVRPGAEAELAALCEQAGVPAVVHRRDRRPALEVGGLFAIPLAELAAAHSGALPALFG